MLIRRARNSARITAAHSNDHRGLRSIFRALKDNTARHTTSRATRGSSEPRLRERGVRAGMITSAAEHGASVFKIQEVSRHKSVNVLSGYVRRANLFDEHAGAPFL